MLYIGLIHNAEDELIDLVEGLVVESIQGENNIILVTLPMTGISFLLINHDH